MLIPGHRTYRYVAWAVMAVLIVLVVATFRDYGVTWDEELQSQYGQAVADYYFSGFKDQRYAEIFNLYLYGGMFDGLAAVIDRFSSPLLIYETRHLLNATFGLVGLWGVWRVARLLGGELTALVALVLCAATPMYYGHMFNNPKDIPFAAGIVWSIYFMIRAYAKPVPGTLVKLSCVLGLTLGVRVGGAMILGFWALPMGVQALLPWLRDMRDAAKFKSGLADAWRLAWRVFAPVAAIAYIVMLVCWPWAQQHPILNPWRALSEFSNFPQDVEVLLDGVNYRSTELPWFYVPLYFAIQLPLLLSGLLLLSLALLPQVWRHFTDVQRQGFSLIALMAGFPILYAMLRHPALYDTVRHFLFAVPLACVVAALAARAILAWMLARFQSHGARHAAAAVLAAAFLATIAVQATIMIRLHPYEYIFANALTGGVRGAFGRYESDYWGSSFKEAAQDLQAYVAKEGGVPPGRIYKIAICGPWASAMIYLPPDYEPVVANEPAEFFLATTRWLCQDMRPGKVIGTVSRMDVPLAVLKDLRNGYEHYPGNAHDKK